MTTYYVPGTLDKMIGKDRPDAHYSLEKETDTRQIVI